MRDCGPPGPYLQRLISDELELRRTPTLEFVYDVSVDQGMRIQAMLKASGARVSLCSRGGDRPHGLGGAGWADGRPARRAAE